MTNANETRVDTEYEAAQRRASEASEALYWAMVAYDENPTPSNIALFRAASVAEDRALCALMQSSGGAR